jgi:hypothetical protein
MQQRRKRFQTGCVFLDAKTKTWFFRYYVDGKRKAERIGTKKEFPTKAQAKQSAEPVASKDHRCASPGIAPLRCCLGGLPQREDACTSIHSAWIYHLGRELHSA